MMDDTFGQKKRYAPICLVKGGEAVHLDPSQRVNGFLTLAGGVIITFAKEILSLITGG